MTGRASSSPATAPRRAPARSHYAVRSHVRGRHHLGPLGVRVRDPFGLSNRDARAPGDQPTSLVLPAVHPLARGPPAGQRRRRRGRASRTWSPCTARTTCRSASTATATTCAGSTGRRPPAPATSWSARRTARPAGGRWSCWTPGRRGHRGTGHLELVRVGGHRCRLHRRAPVRPGLRRAPGQRRDRRRRPGGQTIELDHALDGPGRRPRRTSSSSSRRCCTRPTR